MSVLLTACKNKAKSKKKTQQKGGNKREAGPVQPAAGFTANAFPFNQTPPTSTSTNVVWHWLLDSTPTTIMLDKKEQSLWCNGSQFPADELFEDGYLAFGLQVKKEKKEHEALIKRVDGEHGMDFQLFVDDFSILEHVGTELVLPAGGAASGDVGKAAVYTDPPSDKKKL